MKKLNLLLILSLVCTKSFTQIIDSFHYSGTPKSNIWNGNLADFYVDSGSINSNSEQVNHRFYLSSPIKRRIQQGELPIQLKLNTSSKNYAEIHVCADSAELDLAQNSFYLRIGDTKDQIQFYTKQNGNEELIKVSHTSKTHSFSDHIIWNRINDTMFRFNILDSAIDINTKVCRQLEQDSFHAGFLIQQSTKSFFKKHNFGLLYIGNIPPDLSPPLVKSIQKFDSSWQFGFNEKLDVSFGKIELNPSANHSLYWLDSQLVEIKLDTLISVNQQVIIILSGFKDLAGNQILDTLFYYYEFKPDSILSHDILITELMVDPEPQVNLPNSEYIELYNSSNKYFDLGQCELHDLKGKIALPDYEIKPNDYLFLIPEKDSNLFLKQDYPNRVLLPKWLSLNNDFDQFKIQCAGNPIHSVEYQSSDYKNGIKAEGGWSLEMIDKNNPCNPLNFDFSVNETGGTPGLPNSISRINIDSTAPFVTKIAVGGSSIILYLSETIKTFNLGKSSFQMISESLELVDVIINNEKEVELSFNHFFEIGELYTIEIKAIEDCVGNQLSDHQIVFSKGKKPEVGEVIFNEILFNPDDDKNEFIELYNTSNFAIDLSEIQLAEKTAEGAWDQSYGIGMEDEIMMPNSYLTICKSGNNIWNSYPISDSATQSIIGDFPSLNNKEGSLFLINKKVQEIDVLNYSESQHFDLLDDVKGVSLERIHPNANSNAITTWTSASKSVNFASPGLKNSQFILPKSTVKLKLENNPLSPNSDGYNDQLIIHYSTKNPASQVDVKIYTLKGNLEAVVESKLLSSTKNTLVWDGVNRNKQLSQPGIYIIKLQIIDSKGNLYKAKEVFSIQY